MCANVVAMLRRLDEGGKARQMWGAMSESNSWFMRSLTRHALRRARARSTGARELRVTGAGAIAGDDLGVGARELRGTATGAIAGEDLGVGDVGGTATVAFGVADFAGLPRCLFLPLRGDIRPWREYQAASVWVGTPCILRRDADFPQRAVYAAGNEQEMRKSGAFLPSLVRSRRRRSHHQAMPSP